MSDINKTIRQMFPDHKDHNAILEYSEELIKHNLDIHNSKKNSKSFNTGVNEQGNCARFILGCLRNSKDQSESDECGNALIDSNLNIYNKLFRGSQIKRLSECWGLLSDEVKATLRIEATQTIHYNVNRWKSPELQKIFDRMNQTPNMLGLKDELKPDFDKIYKKAEELARKESQMIVLWRYMRDNRMTLNYLKNDDGDDNLWDDEDDDIPIE